MSCPGCAAPQHNAAPHNSAAPRHGSAQFAGSQSARRACGPAIADRLTIRPGLEAQAFKREIGKSAA